MNNRSLSLLFRLALTTVAVQFNILFGARKEEEAVK